MSAEIATSWPAAGRASDTQTSGGIRAGTVIAVDVPDTPLLAIALTNATWSDAYAAFVPIGAEGRDPQEWADKIFRAPSWPVRALIGVRQLAVRAVGIEPGSSHAFDTLARTPNEVLLGTDQKHLSFRASVLVEVDRVVVSTVVQVHNHRGRAYFAIVCRIHPWVVRRMLARATKRMEVAT